MSEAEHCSVVTVSRDRHLCKSEGVPEQMCADVCVCVQMASCIFTISFFPRLDFDILEIGTPPVKMVQYGIVCDCEDEAPLTVSNSRTPRTAWQHLLRFHRTWRHFWFTAGRTTTFHAISQTALLTDFMPIDLLYMKSSVACVCRYWFKGLNDGSLTDWFDIVTSPIIHYDHNDLVCNCMKLLVMVKEVVCLPKRPMWVFSDMLSLWLK